MPTLKLNRRTIAKLQPGAKTIIYYDEDLTGLGLKVLPSGAMSWLVEYRVGSGGRTAQKRRLVIGRLDDATTPELARERASKILAAVRLGTDVAAKRHQDREALTISEMGAEFLKLHVQPKRKPRTHEFYTQVIKSHIDPALGARRSTSLTQNDVSRMHASVADSAGRYAANRCLAVLSAIFGWAEKEGLIPRGHHNPAANIERFKEARRERYLTTVELGRLGASLRLAETTGLPWIIKSKGPHRKHVPTTTQTETMSPHVTAAIRLLIFTGARLREILNLEWTQVDLERGLLILPDSKTGQKTIVLSQQAQVILAGVPKVGRYVVAGGTAGTKREVPRRDLKRPWAAITRHAQLSDVRLHDLRHTFASVGAGGGLGLPIIGNLLGHKDAKTTARYSHIDASPARAAASQIGATLAAALG